MDGRPSCFLRLSKKDRILNIDSVRFFDYCFGLMKRIDIAGQKYGRWTVIRISSKGDTPIKWDCVCECGTFRSVNSSSLRSGRSPSCGCLTKERMANQGTHNQSGRKNGNKETAEYRIWSGIRKRCLNPRAQRYERYGGRGIKICQRWNNFANFFADMGPRPTQRHSIDRINNDGDYCQENCRWSTPEEQANNRSRNIIVLVNGEKMTLHSASVVLGISYSSSYRRMKSGKLTRI